ncbi:MAG: hypothetical protein KAJ72_00205 [Candidatus Heimdallarchaeota archaeon]|nr:hypothetical protein [Candidatus Heimdallarchaeota archaeon]MCK5408906.1 hypothetical protein [Candidatus Heimdallarchaeota archaeon]
MRYLEVQENGSLVESQELELGNQKVLIIVDENEKRMWLWKGSECPIRKKFIGSRALSDLRKKEYGFAYVPQTCDQDDETAEFVSMLKKINKADLVPDNVKNRAEEIIERQKRINVFDESQATDASKPVAVKIEESGAQLKDRPTQVSSNQLPAHIAKMGAPGNRPTPSILSALEAESIEIKKPEELSPVDSSPTTTTVASVPTTASAPVAKVEESMLEKSLKILKDLGAPKGFFRDLVIIGNKVYTETYTGAFEELDEPPEGIFFSSSHVPRMICENGFVRAIEFLKPEEGAELSEEDEKIAQDIEDLLSMFEIEVG